MLAAAGSGLVAGAQTAATGAASGAATSSVAVLMLAVFGGAMSFSLLSAFWLIRERAKTGQENRELRQRFADLRADRDRLTSLVTAGDHCTIVWEADGAGPIVVGALPPDCGAPQDDGDIAAFGNWLAHLSAGQLDAAVEELRASAVPFTLVVTTVTGKLVEVHGQVSGSQALVRFDPIGGTREALSKLQTEYSRLIGRFALIEKLFAQFPAPVWIANAADKLQYVNPAYAQAVESDNVDDAVDENRPLFDLKEREAIERAQSDNGSYFGNLPAIVAGDRKTLETYAVSDEQGRAGISIDRSDVEAIRATLKHTIVSHEQTFDHLTTAVAIFDVQQRLQFHNSSFQKLWSISPRDLDGQPTNGEILELLRGSGALPEIPDWHKWKQGQLEVYHSTEAKEDYWHLPDGRTLRVIVNPQNQGGASWVFENLTEELELKSSYNALIRVQGETLDHLNEAVAVFGSDGMARLTNPAFLALWGFDAEEGITDRHIRELSKPILAKISKPKDWETISLGITGMDESRDDLSGRIDLTSGAIFDYRLVKLPEGQSMLTLTDITASVNVERALKDRNDALEESDHLKSRFIQHVSYELRAPLTSIAGFAEILASDVPGKLNTKQAEYLDYITQSSGILKALIDDILDLATIDAGAMQLELTSVDLAGAIDESLEAVTDKLERFQIKTKVKIAKGAKSLIGDPVRIRQIIYNLVSNAVAASPDGGTIKIEAARKGGMLELSVEDQGSGVDASLRATIFERFEGGGAGERRRGAGLGLSIVKSFVELHGGTVEVTDADKRGARFVCRLPAEPVQDLQAAE